MSTSTDLATAWVILLYVLVLFLSCYCYLRGSRAAAFLVRPFWSIPATEATLGQLSQVINLERQVGSLIVLDVEGFPSVLNWYVVHRKHKRLPAVASAFKDFLLAEGATLIEAITHFSVQAETRAGGRRTRPRA